MIVNLLKNKQIFSITLPVKVKGQFWLNDLDENGRTRNFISIEAANNEWVIKSSKTVSIYDSANQLVSEAIIKHYGFYNLKLKGSSEEILLFAELISADRQIMQKIIVAEACELLIGRTNDNSICYENRYISGKHAKLIYDGKSWSIIDMGSTNGTYVNGYRVSSRNLQVGDYIYIMGLKIIVGKQFFAVNNPDNSVKLTSAVFRLFAEQRYEGHQEEADIKEVSYFSRSPRFRHDFETVQIEIDPPPAVQKIDQVPLALMLGPSLTMGLTSLSTGLLSVMNVVNNNGDIRQALPTMMMSVSMLIGTVLWPILTKRHEKKMKRKAEKKRQEKYLAYLNTVSDEIKRKCKEQSDILYENIIAPEECVERVMAVKRNLWERTLNHTDFLKLRLGIGNLPLDAEIKYPEKKFTLEEDSLQAALLTLGDEPKQLVDVPVSISLTDYYISGIIGNRAEVLALTRSMLLQAVSLHSYDELKIVLLVDKEELSNWEFMKWLPHIWNNERTVRYLAADADEVKELSVMLEKSILAVRENDGKTEFREAPPYYLIIAASMELTLKCESINKLLRYKGNAGFSILTLFNEIKNLPKETSGVIEVNGGRSKLFHKDDLTGKAQVFAADQVKLLVMEQVSQAIANITLDISEQRFMLPNMITLLEMFQVSKIEHLNVLTRWKDNNPTISLQTPVGVNTAGEPFLLDLHETFHGPHGLVAGMTGSGKSEFIITYILSLAINYHPDEVAFILIDYKGGGLAGAFEDEERGIKLPHLAGTITNLDGTAVKRSLISLQSELRRRQAIFNEARKISNEGTMDIYKYQQLYRENVVSEPIPHLFIISDEFAELKAQQPDFMEQLISAARIGRSLGVHLILATQKPSGVVDDQIWSNSKFRICLKVQEKADSMDMIKCPDAAELSQTGRFYLQVGFNELFALGQSAWCGANYVPAENTPKKTDLSIQVIDHLGHVIREVKPIKREASDESKMKQVVAAVKYLSDLAKEEQVAVRPMWLDAIPGYIYVEDLEQKYNYQPTRTILNPIVGEYDDPFNQRQNVLTLPLTENGNCIVYGATGSGKEMFLATLVFALIKNHDAEALNFYVLDFGAEILRMFDKAPQAGGIIFSHENDKITNLFKLLGKEMDNRKKLFAEYGGDYFSYCKNSGAIKPNIVVIINNYSGFAELYEELEERFTLLSRDGLKYGIYFVLTASSTNAVRYRIQQNFKQILTMQLNDENDYSILVGKTEGLVPTRLKGRGLVNLGRVYEFQAAYYAEGQELFEYTNAYCAALRDRSQIHAKPVPILPEIVNTAVVQNEITDLTAVPVGITKKSLVVAKLNIASRLAYPVIAHETHQLRQFVQGLAEVLAIIGADVRVLDAEQLFAADALKKYTYIADNFEKEIQDLFAHLVTRNNTYKDSQMNLLSLAGFGSEVIVIGGFKKLMGQLSDDGKDKLKVMLNKGEAIYKMHYIIAETTSGISEYSYEEWYRKNITGADGIWVGDGFSDQYILKPSKVTAEHYEENGDEFGYVVTRNKPVLVKLLSAKVTDEWEEGMDE